ncbi:MAG: ATP-binding cassette domain-containing protein [Gammaproteobacteria bacterium]|nr:ATP-binding cassette domain-containing protein [Gammaproteobacteria bacterium]
MDQRVSNSDRPRASATLSNVVRLDRAELTLPSRAGSVDILRGITWSVPQGRSVAVVGPSGSGKTSLLMIIAGLERATTGKVEIVGHDFSALGEDDLAAVRGRSIGIVFQSFHLVPTMTAFENVALPLELIGRADAAERARALLGDVGLSGRLDHYPAQLSGGEQQRVALARALAPNPRLLLADEPTGNLDKATGRTVIDLLFRLQKRDGATLILVTHDESLAAECDETVRMADGLIMQPGNSG